MRRAQLACLPEMETVTAPGQDSPPSDVRTTALATLLERIGAGPIRRVLDVGGARFGGVDTTLPISGLYPNATVDVVRLPQEELREQTDRIAIVSDSYTDLRPGYDLIVLSPGQSQIVASWERFPYTWGSLLAGNGIVVGLGVNPQAIGNKDFQQPAPAIWQQFCDGFGCEDGTSLSLPRSLQNSYELIDIHPWRERSKSYLLWLAARRRPGRNAMSPIATLEPFGERLAPFDDFNGMADATALLAASKY